MANHGIERGRDGVRSSDETNDAKDVGIHSSHLQRRSYASAPGGSATFLRNRIDDFPPPITLSPSALV